MALKGILRHVQRITAFIVDGIFPRDARTVELLSLSPSDFYKKTARPFSRDGIDAILEYRHPLVQRAIWELKYQGNEEVAVLLAGVLSDFLLERLSDEASWSHIPIVLAPIPLGLGRQKERGYNQVELILKHMFKRTPELEIRLDVLTKIRETPSQTSKMKRTERLQNIKNAFAASHDAKGLHIVLIDDVTTTGATLSEARRTLLEKGAEKVTCVALAH